MSAGNIQEVIIEQIKSLMKHLEAFRDAEKHEKYVRVGKTNGRKKIALNKAQEIVFDSWLEGELTATNCAALLGISRTTLYTLKKRLEAK